MKKIFTLFAAAMLGVCAFAQMPETCPSELGLKLLNGDNPAQVEVELTVINSSLNLNGFNTELQLGTEEAPATAGIAFKKVSRKAFTAAGYANVILARLDDATDEEREELLLEFCDVQSNIKESGNLVIIELLKTNECRFFPQLAEHTAIGKFWMDWSAIESKDGDVPSATLYAPAIPSRYSFSYTGGVEGTRAWTPEAPLEYTLYLVDGKVTDVPPTTGISTISTDKNVDNRIFDLQGRELQSVPEHGIYIQNGKKYVK